jgi:hypothetical protein
MSYPIRYRVTADFRRVRASVSPRTPDSREENLSNTKSEDNGNDISGLEGPEETVSTRRCAYDDRSIT